LPFVVDDPIVEERRRQVLEPSWRSRGARQAPPRLHDFSKHRGAAIRTVTTTSTSNDHTHEEASP
jgi:hypothetical protein